MLLASRTAKEKYDDIFNDACKHREIYDLNRQIAIQRSSQNNCKNKKLRPLFRANAGGSPGEASRPRSANSLFGGFEF